MPACRMNFHSSGTRCKPFRRQITGSVLNVSFSPELKQKMALVFKWPVSNRKRAINKKNVLPVMVSGDSMYLLC